MESVTSFAASSSRTTLFCRWPEYILLRRNPPSATLPGRCGRIMTGLVAFEELLWGGTGGGSSRICIFAGGGGLGVAIKPSCEVWLPHEYGDDSMSLVRSILRGDGRFILLFVYDLGSMGGSWDMNLSYAWH